MQGCQNRQIKLNKQYHTRPGAAACPPVPYPAHTATVVYRGGTLSGSSPGKQIISAISNQPSIQSKVQQQ